MSPARRTEIFFIWLVVFMILFLDMGDALFLTRRPNGGDTSARSACSVPISAS